MKSSIRFRLLYFNPRSIPSRSWQWRSRSLMSEVAASSVSGRYGGFGPLPTIAHHRRLVEPSGRCRRTRKEGAGGSRGLLIHQLGLLPALSLASSPPHSERALLLLQKSSIEAREQCGNSIDIRLSIHYDGSNTSKKELLSHIDAIFHLERQLDQKILSRIEIEHLEELLDSRTTTPSTLPSSYKKNKEKINDDSSTNPILSHQEASVEKEKGTTVNIHEEGRDSPIEIARAYMASRPRRIPSFGVGLQSTICHKEKVSFGNKLARARIASKSALCFPISEDSRENYKIQTPQEKSRLYELAGPPYGRSSMFTNPRVLSFQESNPYKTRNIAPTRTFKWKSPYTRHFGHGQALKRGRLDDDVRCSHDARRVRHKFCFTGINL